MEENRITQAAGTEVDLSNVTYNCILCQICLVLCTVTMSQTFRGGSGGDFGGGL